MITRLYLTLILVISCTAFVFSQDEYSQPTYETQLANNYKLGLRSRVKDKAKSLPQENKRVLKTFYKSKYKSSLYLTDYKHFYFTSRWNTYLNDILNNILEANPDITEDVQVVLSTYFWPNAFSLGEGTLVINPGLIPELQNEDQLAFVICHELSHYILGHSESSYLDYVDNWSSKKLSRQIEMYSYSYSYENDQLKSLLRTKLYNSLQHKRNFEFQADSLGMKLFKNTTYAESEALYTIQILDDLDAKNKRGIDVLKITKFEPLEVDHETILSNSKASKGSWLEFDSLKTHPECTDRYNRLNALFGIQEAEYKDQFSVQKPQVDFASFQHDMAYFQIESYFRYKRYDMALLSIWQLQENGDKSNYLKRREFYLLCELAYARKKHKLGHYCTLPYDSMDTDQKTLNTILFEQRFKIFVEEMHGFAMEKYNEEFDDERTVYSLALIAYVAGDEDLLNEIKSSYYSRFGRTKYYEIIKYLYI
jgi:hypothetical protein